MKAAPPNLFKDVHFHGIMRALLILLSAVLMSHSLSAEDAKTNPPSEAKEQAHTAFLNANYRQMVNLLVKHLQEHPTDSTSWIKLGNAWYRLKEPGHATWAYHRALQIDPLNAAARQNIAFLNQHLGSTTFPETWQYRITYPLTSNGWLAIASITFWLAVFSLLFLIWSNPSRLWVRVLLSAPLFAGSILTLLALTGYWIKQKHVDPVFHQTQVIISAKPAILRTGATRESSKITELPPGSLLRKIDEANPWIYVEGPEQVRGWIPESEIKPLLSPPTTIEVPLTKPDAQSAA